jgi:hypothetical protein
MVNVVFVYETMNFRNFILHFHSFFSKVKKNKVVFKMSFGAFGALFKMKLEGFTRF